MAIALGLLLAFAAGPAAAADFNNDGFGDVAVGAPNEDAGSAQDVGVVNVLYGSSTGLTSSGAQQFTQSGAGGTTEAGDRFGAATVTGDFNNDSFGDVAVGAPNEDLGSAQDAGVVNVLYGSATGLTSSGAQQFSQSGAGGATELGDQFGSALSVSPDLAIGAPNEDLSSAQDAGVVNVLHRSASGLTSSGAQQFSQSGAGGATEPGDRFGAALTAGNFNDDAFSGDVAAGAPNEDLSAAQDAGVVNVLYDSASGLTSTGAQQITQSGAGGAAETGDQFGSVLLAHNFDEATAVDLAVGVPLEDAGSTQDVGVVNVLNGCSTAVCSAGLGQIGVQQFTQSDAGGALAAGDRFGAALAAGDFDADAAETPDLAVGAPMENLPSAAGAGAVNLIYGQECLCGLGPGASPSRWGSVQQFAQSSAAGITEAGDQFGTTLHAADFNAAPGPDLVVGAPFEDAGSIQDAGVVNVRYGSQTGLTNIGAQQFTQGAAGGTTEPGDQFGSAVR